jgi:5-methyltetrahydrofolate corrinoid/iron sulfur protein methyltransferase
VIVIGESIHIISHQVRAAIDNRGKAFLQDLALRQVERGAHWLDLNIGPQEKAGVETMTWLVNIVQEVTDVPLVLDTTNVEAIEAGLEACHKPALINSTDATLERLNTLMPLAAKYNANIIALTLGSSGLPRTIDSRLVLVLEQILPAAAQYNVPLNHIFLDPLVLTVNGNQEQALQTVEAIRYFKQASEPPPMTTCGLSNISSGAPKKIRPLINRVFLAMMLGAGLDSAIMNFLDDELMKILRIIDSGDKSTPESRLYLSLYNSYVIGEQFDISTVDMDNPKLRDIARTIQILQNQLLYTHSYLNT